MKALVLGGSGQLGNAVVRELLEHGFAVTAASRRAATAANLVDLDVERIAGNTDEPGRLDEWVRGHDLVVDAAAPYPLDAFAAGGAGAEELGRVAARTTALVDAVAEHGARLAFISSFTTQSRRSGLEALPAALWRRLHPYFEVKRRMEEQVLEAARRGLPAVVVNPTTCLGPWDVKPRQRSLVAQLLSGEVVAVAEHRINVIDVREVAAGLVEAVRAERWAEPILLVGHNLRVGELVDWICEAGGAEPPRLRAPAWLNVAPSLLAEGALALLGRTSPSPALVPILLCEQGWFTAGRAQRELGITPRPMSATIADTIGWYRRLGYC